MKLISKIITTLLVLLLTVQVRAQQCKESRERCADTSECCLHHFCLDGKCCRDVGRFCQWDGDCCGDIVCYGGFCSNCSREGDGCSVRVRTKS